MLLLLIGIIGGLFGGLLSALFSKGALDLPYKATTPKTNRKSIRFGFLKHVLLGLGAGLVVIGIVLIIPIELHWLTYLAIAISGGFGGGKTLSSLSDRVTQQADKILDELNNKKDN